MVFSEKLQELRNSKGLTQEELAEVIYVSPTEILKWESGKGYPNIDALKAMANFFGVTIDELISGDELLGVAEADTKQKEKRFHDLAFGLLDLSALMFLVLPFFGQRADGMMEEVALMSLTEVHVLLRIIYFIVVIAIIVSGILTLALQNSTNLFWAQNKIKISLLLNVIGELIFVVSFQPYATAFLFILFTIKVLMLTKKR